MTRPWSSPPRHSGRRSMRQTVMGLTCLLAREWIAGKHQECDGPNYFGKIMVLPRRHRQVIHQLDNLTNLLLEHLVVTRQGNGTSRNWTQEGIVMNTCPLIIRTISNVGYFVFKNLNQS